MSRSVRLPRRRCGGSFAGLVFHRLWYATPTGIGYCTVRRHEQLATNMAVRVTYSLNPHVAKLSKAGPGTELKRILSSWGINPAAGCNCLERVRETDQKGVD